MHHNGWGPDTFHTWYTFDCLLSHPQHSPCQWKILLCKFFSSHFFMPTAWVSPFSVFTSKSRPSLFLLSCISGDFLGTSLPHAKSFLVISVCNTTNNPICNKKFCQVPKSTILTQSLQLSNILIYNFFCCLSGHKKKANSFFGIQYSSNMDSILLHFIF